MNDSFGREIQLVKDELGRQSQDWAVEANHLIFHAANALEAYVNKNHLKYGVSQRGIAILHLLVENDGKLPQKRLTRLLNRTKQAVTSALANLEKRHLVVREEGGRDHRRRSVRITEEGLKIAQECLPLRKQFYLTFMSSVSREEGQQLSAVLNKLSKKVIAGMK
ncbi:MAG: hypothetical protein A2144_12745 [Chloroflexi bacterium RBG_16_50_9]|nr:MAG: hypothetical protein A2144_12745 [Chloroflexi bacterium RBG_16_50_9]